MSQVTSPLSSPPLSTSSLVSTVSILCSLPYKKIREIKIWHIKKLHKKCTFLVFPSVAVSEITSSLDSSIASAVLPFFLVDAFLVGFSFGASSVAISGTTPSFPSSL